MIKKNPIGSFTKIGYSLGKDRCSLGTGICWKSPNPNYFDIKQSKNFTFAISLIFPFQPTNDIIQKNKKSICKNQSASSTDNFIDPKAER